MKTRSFLVLCLILIMRISVMSQVKIGDNATTINSASLLELETTDKGFVLPRVSITDVSSSSPLAAGLLSGTIVYNTNSSTTGGSGIGIYYWDGSKWNFMANTAITGTYWSITGNSGTSSSSNFLGTTDAQALRFKVNNQSSGFIDYSASAITTIGYLASATGTATGTTAFGYKALTLNTTGQNNTAVGNNSVSKNTTGGSNSGFGYNTLANNVSGSNNTALGYRSLTTSTASNNTAGGYASLSANTSGSGNTAFGTNALLSNTTGTNNTAVGYGADVVAPASAGTLTNATAIGYNAKVGSSNTIILGGTAAAAVNVGINTTSPAQKLEISGTGSTIRLGGIGSGNTYNSASTTAASNILYTNNATGDIYSLPTVNSAFLVTNASGIPSWSSSALSGNAWLLNGNSGTSYSNYLGTNDNVSMRFRTNSIERMILDSLGNVGIGISNPSYALSVLSSADPLYLSGVQPTGAFSTDSLLTIYNGVVKKAPYSSLSGASWSLTGNNGLDATNNFIGTTDAIDFVTKTNNTERMRILGANSGSSKAGWIGMGVTIPRSSLDVTGDYTNKNVLTLQNTSSTGFTSVDMLDNTGTLKGTFGYANVGTGGSFGGRTYFNSYGSDLLFTANSGTYHLFLQGGTGNIGINTNAPSQRLHVVGNFYLTGAFMPGGNAGTSGYILTSAGAGTAPTWNNLNGLSWGLTGNSGTSYATNFLGTTDNISMRFRTNNVQRMIIDSLGRVGIGLTNPSNALSVLSASNPLYLSGVQATATFTTDSVLTINAGVVKKTPYSSLTGISWNLTGNSGTNYATNFLGTTDNVGLHFRTNNTEQMIIDSLGRVGIGSSSFNTLNPAKLLVDYGSTTSNTIANLKGDIDSYFQINLQNKSNGANSSSDYVATSNDGTDSTYYVDLGINGGNYIATEDNWGDRMMLTYIPMEEIWLSDHKPLMVTCFFYWVVAEVNIIQYCVWMVLQAT